MSTITAPLPNVSVDAEFQRLIPALLPKEFQQLEANILRDGCQEPLSIWRTGSENILLDGHNRHAICEKHDIKFGMVEVEIADRDHAKLWIEERQLGRRNLRDDQRAVVANDVRELWSAIAQAEQRRAAAQQPRKPENKPSECVKSAQPLKVNRTSAIIAKESKLPERKIRLAQEIKNVDPAVSMMVRAGDLSLVEGRKLVALPAPAREIAVNAIYDGKDVRTAIRAAVRIVSGTEPTDTPQDWDLPTLLDKLTNYKINRIEGDAYAALADITIKRLNTSRSDQLNTTIETLSHAAKILAGLANTLRKVQAA